MADGGFLTAGARKKRGTGRGAPRGRGSVHEQGRNAHFGAGNHHSSVAMGQRLSRDRPNNDPYQPTRWIDYPFLKETDTISVVGQSKVLFLLRGLPGSGKSFIADQLHSVYPRAIMCSADDYFSRDGIYHWQPHLLPNAHQSCRDRTKSACSNNRNNVVVVDNTNITLEEMDPYVMLANDTGYVLVVVQPKTPWRRDTKQLVSRSIHGVPLNAVRKRLDQWEMAIPLYYAWFLNEADALALDAVAQAYLDECSRSSVFLAHFRQFASCDGKDLHQFFNNFTVADGPLHCTANYCGTEERPGDRDYAKRKDVTDACGRAYPMTIVGFIITPRTFGARVQLGRDALLLWNQDDNEAVPTTNSPSCGVQESGLTFKLERLSISGNLSPCTATLHWNREDLVVKDKLCPTNGRGSRAHLTVGCSSGNKAVQTGLDLLDIIRCEQKLGVRQPEASFHVHQGSACCYGEGRWGIYLKKAITVQSVFAGYYVPNE